MFINKCRFCGLEASYETFDLVNGYWNSFLYICHIDCKENGVKDEAYQCQIIDADCNDCKHFKREKMVQKGQSSIWEGSCVKLNKPMRAYPNFSSGHKCFEHRKS